MLQLDFATALPTKTKIILYDLIRLKTTGEGPRLKKLKNQVNKKMLQEAFSLLAYADPWNSPVGAQLDPARRETICSALNSAILGKQISIYILKLLLVSASVLV